MFKSFGLNLYNDIEFNSHNDIVMIDAEDEATQALKLLVGTRAGEWFLNTDHGLDYFVFLGEKWDRVQDATRAAFMRCLAQESRIEEVLDLSFDWDAVGRILTANFTVRMDGRIMERSLGVSI